MDLSPPDPLVRLLGGRLLDYACGVPPGTFPVDDRAMWMEGQAMPVLAGGQAEVVAELTRKIDTREVEPLIDLAKALVSSFNDDGQSVVNVLRAIAGGSFPDTGSADAAESMTLRVALGLYPWLLLGDDEFTLRTDGIGSIDSDVLFGVFATLHRPHPLRADLRQALGAGPGAPSEEVIRADNLVELSLHGATLELLARRYEPTAEELLERVRAHFAAARREGDERGTAIATIAALYGVAVESRDLVIKTPWGEVREIGRILSAFSFGGRNSGHETGSVIFEIDRGGRSDEEQYAYVSRALRLFSLAVLMAGGEAARPVPLLAWSTNIGPGHVGSSLQASTPLRFPQPPPNPVDAVGANAIEVWCGRLDAIPDEELDRVAIAIDRLINAVSNRFDHGGSLVDAVMVWENLFGSKQETTFKLTAALALLLEPKNAERRNTLKRLQKTYRIRSELVHGAAVDPGDLFEARNHAIEVALGLLRLVLDEKRHLLPLQRRAEAVILRVTDD